MSQLLYFLQQNLFFTINALTMNISQILYKISNLRYNILKKEVEYTAAVNTGDQHNMDLNNAALALLKEDLVGTFKAFNSIPAHGSNNRFKSLMAKLFQFRTAFNKK
jgi:hypothetical protein